MCSVHVVSNLGSDWFSEGNAQDPSSSWHLFHEMQPMGLRDLSMQWTASLFDPTEKYDLLPEKTRIPAAL